MANALQITITNAEDIDLIAEALTTISVKSDRNGGDIVRAANEALREACEDFVAIQEEPTDNLRAKKTELARQADLAKGLAMVHTVTL